MIIDPISCWVFSLCLFISFDEQRVLWVLGVYKDLGMHVTGRLWSGKLIR